VWRGRGWVFTFVFFVCTFSNWRKITLVVKLHTQPTHNLCYIISLFDSGRFSAFQLGLWGNLLLNYFKGPLVNVLWLKCNIWEQLPSVKFSFISETQKPKSPVQHVYVIHAYKFQYLFLLLIFYFFCWERFIGFPVRNFL